jgi:HD-like signal output (HDOD) protein
MAAGPSPQSSPRPLADGPPPGCAQALVDVASVPAFAPVALRLLNIVSQENIGLNQLAGLIRADPGISVEVLRLANSPLFGARSEITGILHAIAMLGLNRIKSMVMTVAVRDFLAPARDSDVFAPCWRHCLATAFVAEEIALHGSQDPDSSYTAGILHEIGQLALIAARPAQYDHIVRLSDEEGRDLAGLERQYFGIDRRALGVRLLERWKLPRHFQAIVEGSTPLVHTACRIAAFLGFRVAGADEEFDPASLPALPPGMLQDSAALDELMAAVATKINTVECSLVMV